MTPKPSPYPGKDQNTTTNANTSTKTSCSQYTPMGRWMSEDIQESPWSVYSYGYTTHMGAQTVEAKQSKKEDNRSIKAEAGSEKDGM
ncbi:hypothetical protein EG329_014240 [Mollisiaceae sp. DMI_Dod_QoI]|nr:hypothetical protein EG329_014240 [Helotiales sp. DMI_Dod_QoI]